MSNYFLNLYLNIFFAKIYIYNSILIYNEEFLPEKCFQLCSKIGGLCDNDLKCICQKGYSTDFSEENFQFCNYKQYNKVITGFIELFFGFGSGHFYCKRYLNGYIQLSIEFIFCCMMACLISIYYGFDNLINNGYPYYTNIISYYYLPILIFIFALWQIVDSILFFCSYFKDGNGINLY